MIELIDVYKHYTQSGGGKIPVADKIDEQMKGRDPFDSASRSPGSSTRRNSSSCC